MNKKNSLVDFGKAGWGVIIFCMAMFYFFVGFCTDGNNVSAPAAAAHLGVDAGTILVRNSYAGLIGVVFYIVMSQLARKIGAKKVAAICLIIAGISFYFIGNPPSLLGYTIAYTFLIGSSMSSGYVAGGALVAKWFPKKKGLVMGYTTAGLNIASATWVLLMTKLSGVMTFEKAVIIPCIAVVILGLIGLFFIKDTPQEAGQNPDNVSDEVYAKEYDTKNEAEDDRWTTGQLLRMKEVWTVGLATGILQLCSTGVMSQLVSRNIELGMDANKAVLMMTVIALVGIFGSWFIGVLDDKFGTKKTMMVFCLWYALAVFANVLGTTYSPGLSIEGAKWFVEHHVRGVGFDMQAIDHILYTYAADHGPGPYVPRIVEEYEEQFGHPAKDDFPEWEPCHDILMSNNVMGIENLGGDLDKVTNQRFLFCAFPLRWYMGDGTIVRAVAFVPSDRIDRSVPDKEYPYGVY